MFPCARTLFLAACVGLPAVAPAQNTSNPAFAPVEDQAGLPRVLLIGDSISIGYTVPVRELLQGEANVHRIPVNGGTTQRGLDSIDQWLGESKWDVIHFNWGLHDLRYADAEDHGADPKIGKQRIAVARYEMNLDKLVARLQQTGAKLIWCATTPIPEGAFSRVAGSELEYNAAAARVMEKHGVAIDELYAFAEPRLSEIQQPRNVHFTADGSRVLAGQSWPRSASRSNPDRELPLPFAMPKVVFTPHLARHVASPPQTAQGETVRAALEHVFGDNPRLRGYILDDQGALRRHVVIFIDGKTLGDRERLTDPVLPDSEIYVMQALSGG